MATLKTLRRSSRDFRRKCRETAGSGPSSALRNIRSMRSKQTSHTEQRRSSRSARRASIARGRAACRKSTSRNASGLRSSGRRGIGPADVGPALQPAPWVCEPAESRLYVQNSSPSDSISPPPPISSSRRPGTMPETLEPTELAVSRTCSTTRLITLGLEAARVVLLLRGDALRAVLRFGAARLAVLRLAAAFFPPRRAAAHRDSFHRILGRDRYALRRRLAGHAAGLAGLPARLCAESVRCRRGCPFSPPLWRRSDRNGTRAVRRFARPRNHTGWEHDRSADREVALSVAGEDLETQIHRDSSRRPTRCANVEG